MKNDIYIQRALKAYLSEDLKNLDQLSKILNCTTVTISNWHAGRSQKINDKRWVKLYPVIKHFLPKEAIVKDSNGCESYLPPINPIAEPEYSQKIFKIIPENLSYYRQLANISQTEIADYFQITRQLVSAWEKGINPIADKYHEDITQLLGVTKEQLITPLPKRKPQIHDEYMVPVLNGEKLKYHRKVADMSQKQLAEKLNVSQMCVVSWEKGRTQISPRYHDKLIEILGPSIIKQESFVFSFEMIVKHNDNQIYTQRFGNIDLPKLINYLNTQP